MDELLPAAANATFGAAFNAIYRLSPYAERTVLVPKALQGAVATIGENTGFDGKTIAFAAGTYLCYPLAFLMYIVPYGIPKHIASFIFGAFLLQFTISGQWVHMLVTSLIVYLMFLSLSTKSAKRVVPLFLMTYLSVGHLHQMYANYNKWSLNFTTPQMIVTIKLYSLAYNLYDGERLLQAQRDGREVERGTKRCANSAVFRLPHPIEYLGYVFCFSTVLAGPAIEYRTYADACSGTLLYRSDGVPRGKPPSRALPTLRPFLVSVACMALYMVGAAKFPFLDPAHPSFDTPVILGETFLARPFYQRFAYTYVSFFFVRMRYYFPWKSAEGSTNLWYGGFEGFDENGKGKGFGNSCNVDIMGFELCTSFKTATKRLNKKTASWLSRYVYGRTNGSVLATYFVSAFWHGFYPGYYLYFLSSPLLTICERVGSRKLVPYIDSDTRWKRAALISFNHIWLKVLVFYMAGPFFLLSMDWSIAWWKSYYFYGHIACFLFYTAAALLPISQEKSSSHPKHKSS